MTWTSILSLTLGVAVIWLIGANIMSDVLCRMAIDGVLEMRARRYPEEYVQAAIAKHHEQHARMALLWPISGIAILIGIIRAGR